MRPYWEDIVDWLEDSDESGVGIRRGSAGYEVVCVDMTWAGNGDRLPPAVDRNQRKQLYVARVNENHFVPLVAMGDRRFLRPVPPRALHASSSSLLRVPAGGPAEGPSAGVPASDSAAAPVAAPTVVDIETPPAASASAGAHQTGAASGGDGGQRGHAPPGAFAQGGVEGAGVAAAAEGAGGVVREPTIVALSEAAL